MTETDDGIQQNNVADSKIFNFIFSHGEKWDKFRAQVQHVMLQPSTAKKYVAPLNDITSDFMERWVRVIFIGGGEESHGYAPWLSPDCHH